MLFHCSTAVLSTLSLVPALHSRSLETQQQGQPEGFQTNFFEVSTVRGHLRKASDCKAVGASAFCCLGSSWLQRTARVCTFALPPLIHQFHPIFSLCAPKIRLYSYSMMRHGAPGLASSGTATTANNNHLVGTGVGLLIFLTWRQNLLAALS